MLIQMHIVSQPDTQFPERRNRHFFVFSYVSREVRNEHGAGRLSVDGDSEVLHRRDIHQHISVMVRRTQHAFVSRDGRTPLLRFGIAALLIGVPYLEGEERTVVHFSFYIHSAHPRSTRVRAHEEQISFGIPAHLAKYKNILQIGIEPFGGQVHFPFAELLVPVGTERGTVRILGAEVRVECDERHLSAYSGHVQVFVVGLRRTITAAVSGSEHQALDGRIAEGSTGCADRFGQKIMLLQTCAHQHTPLFAFPFVLGIHTRHVHILLEVTMIA